MRYFGHIQSALRGKALSVWLKGLTIACVFGLAVVGLSGETRERLMSGFDPSDQSNSLRLGLWQANLKILNDYPWGIGYNANDQLIDEAFDALGLPKHQWMGHSHNEFLEIAVGSGWLGLLLYLTLTAWLFLRTLKAYRDSDNHSLPWTSFVLLSSILIQLFINACALTDQMSTPGRYLLCMAWAVAIVAPIEAARRSACVSEMDSSPS
ncbi:MAG: O-antigen ligase family protein [Verrucomicrobiota bacterium]